MSIRKTTLALACITALAIPATASATTSWVNTPRNVESNVLNNWTTSDGESVAQVSCRGLWSSTHRRLYGSWNFHLLRCDEYDDVGRYFDIRVTVAGPGLALRVAQLACDASQADAGWRCP